ncbi:MAG: signal peptidase I [Chloroflexi bacterium]|nr:signal peptidase I [Chloroflexota bacterium]
MSSLDFENSVDPLEIEQKGKSCLQTFIVETLETIILAVLLYVVINAATARIRVDGSSMIPSFINGDYVIVNKLSYRFGEIERGDVIVFPSPQRPNDDLIKRVIGLPGERVRIIEGQVFIDDQILIEPYINAPVATNFPETLVPEGAIFVMGDNRNNSSDSRGWFTHLKIKDVLGKAVFIYWPFENLDFIQHFNYATTQP